VDDRRGCLPAAGQGGGADAGAGLLPRPCQRGFPVEYHAFHCGRQRQEAHHEQGVCGLDRRLQPLPDLSGGEIPDDGN